MERLLDSKSDRKAYKNLEVAAAILNTTSDDLIYSVEDCYFDYGQEWLWTTIIVKDPSSDSEVLGSYQFLDPREWKDITNATSLQVLLNTIKDIIEKKGLSY